MFVKGLEGGRRIGSNPFPVPMRHQGRDQWASTCARSNFGDQRKYREKSARLKGKMVRKQHLFRAIRAIPDPEGPTPVGRNRPCPPGSAHQEVGCRAVTCGDPNTQSNAQPQLYHWYQHPRQTAHQQSAVCNAAFPRTPFERLLRLPALNDPFETAVPLPRRSATRSLSAPSPRQAPGHMRDPSWRTQSPGQRLGAKRPTPVGKRRAILPVRSGFERNGVAPAGPPALPQKGGAAQAVSRDGGGSI